VRAAPAVSRAMCIKKCAHEHTGLAETLRPSLRNGFTAYFVLAPVTGFLATVICESFGLPRNLTPAPGRQAHTTSPYAWVTLVFVAFASTASHPASVTIAKRPPSGTGPRRCNADLGSRSRRISENQKSKGRRSDVDRPCASAARTTRLRRHRPARISRPPRCFARKYCRPESRR
jgi:hypothetical protein